MRGIWKRARLAAPAVVAAVLWLGVAAGTASAQGAERIDAYDVDVQIEGDGALLVVERIEYDFGVAERHGIFRDLPIRFHYDERYDRVYRVEVLEVVGSPGTPAQYQLEQEGALLRIRIGDPDETISGPHSYRITYRVEGALNGFSDHDELYWNAVGTDWAAPIGRASATVTAPASVGQVACFAGPFGSNLPCASTSVRGETATFGHGNLGPFEGLTVVVGFPTGAVPRPEPILVERWSFARAFAATPLTLGLAGALLLLAVALIGRLLWVSGRDRRAVGSAVEVAFADTGADEQRVPLMERSEGPVEFEPPDGLRPGQVGVLVDEVVSPVDVTATLVDLAVRGYLRIEEIPKRWLLGKPDWRLVKLKATDGQLRGYERQLLDGLFRGDDEDEEPDLEGEPDTTAEGLSDPSAAPGLATVTMGALRRKFHLRYERVRRALYDDVVRQGWFAARPDRVRIRWAVIGVFLIVVGVGLVILAAATTHLGLVPIPIVLAGLVLAFGARMMPRRTPRGTGLVQRALGFRRFIESPTPAAHARFAEERNLFSDYLPYAIVFGLTDRWARAFADLGIAPDTRWYAGTRPFSPYVFASSIDSFAVSSAGTLTSRPAASGSSGLGGGGFSGGGGGGGGGGSW